MNCLEKDLLIIHRCHTYKNLVIHTLNQQQMIFRFACKSIREIEEH